MNTLGQVVKRAREAKGWSQEELAERLGVSKGWVGQVETGRIDRPRPKYLALLEEHLGVTRDDLARGMDMIGPAATGDVLVENTATEEEPYNPFYFKVKDDTGVEATVEMNIAQGALKSGKLPPGDKVKGTVAFKVKQGATGLVMTYEPLVIFGGYKPIRIALD